MTEKEYWLLKVAEESTELAQAALKIAYFGEEGVNPKDPHHVNNLHSVMLEYAHVMAAFGNYLEIAAETATWKALPFEHERVVTMIRDASYKQLTMAKTLYINGVIQ